MQKNTQITTRIQSPQVEIISPERNQPQRVPPVVLHIGPPAHRSPAQTQLLVQATTGGGLAQICGLHAASAALTVFVDMLVFGADVLSLGVLIPVGIAVGGVLGYIVYRIQKQWYGDSHDAAITKALIVGLLTAIPIPLGPLMAIPCGVLGLMKYLNAGNKQ